MTKGISYQEQVELDRYARSSLIRDYNTILSASEELNELAEMYYPEPQKKYIPQSTNQIKEKELKKEFKDLSSLLPK